MPIPLPEQMITATLGPVENTAQSMERGQARIEFLIQQYGKLRFERVSTQTQYPIWWNVEREEKLGEVRHTYAVRIEGDGTLSLFKWRSGWIRLPYKAAKAMWLAQWTVIEPIPVGFNNRLWEKVYE